jgi:hypothetical protein
MHGRPAGWLAVIPSHRMEDYYALPFVYNPWRAWSQSLQQGGPYPSLHTCNDWDQAPGAAENARKKTVDLAQNLEVY